MSQTAPLPQEQQAPQIAEVLPQIPPPSMAWHGFVCRCMLWVAAPVHLAQAAWLLLGGPYYRPEVRQAIYGGLPALRILDWLLAALLIAAAVLQLLARHDLARLRWRGAIHLRAAYGLLAGGMALYWIARWICTGLSSPNPALLGQAAAYGALLWVHASYYRKRRNMLAPAKGEI